MTIWTVSDQIYYAYANLAMAYDAVSKGLIKYDRICFMIRSRLYKGLQKGDMKIHSLLDDEKTQVAKWHQMCLLRRRYRDLDRPYDSTNKGGTDISDNLVCACKTCNSSKGKKDIMEWYNDKQSFPPLMLLRRYIKLIYNYCYTDCLPDLKLDDPKLNSLPFSIKSLPINYPTPDKLQH